MTKLIWSLAAWIWLMFVVLATYLGTQSIFGVMTKSGFHRAIERTPYDDDNGYAYFMPRGWAQFEGGYWDEYEGEGDDTEYFSFGGAEEREAIVWFEDYTNDGGLDECRIRIEHPDGWATLDLWSLDWDNTFDGVQWTLESDDDSSISYYDLDANGLWDMRSTYRDDVTVEEMRDGDTWLPCEADDDETYVVTTEDGTRLRFQAGAWRPLDWTPPLET